MNALEITHTNLVRSAIQFQDDIYDKNGMTIQLVIHPIQMTVYACNDGNELWVMQKLNLKDMVTRLYDFAHAFNITVLFECITYMTSR